jgi:hypothetical protein
MVVEGPTTAQLLEQWRAAERRRNALMPGSMEYEMAAAECDALAAAYRAHVDDRLAAARQLLGRDAGDGASAAGNRAFLPGEVT